jgi:hypothetical protein
VLQPVTISGILAQQKNYCMSYKDDDLEAKKEIIQVLVALAFIVLFFLYWSFK